MKLNKIDQLSKTRTTSMEFIEMIGAGLYTIISHAKRSYYFVSKITNVLN